MPFRRKYRSYRKRNTRYYRRFRRKKTFTLRRQIGMDGLITKLRLAPSTQQSSGGGVLQSYYGVRNPEGALDWTGLSALYDFYRVFAVKLQWIPALPNNPSTATAFAPMYIITDQDDYDTTNLTTSSVYLQYPRCTVKNLYRPFKYYSKMNKLVTATRGNIGTITTFNILGNGFFDINTRPDNGIVSWYANGLTASTTYGQFIITIYLAFKNRR